MTSVSSATGVLNPPDSSDGRLSLRIGSISVFGIYVGMRFE